jgi:hypothetical protein
MRKGKCRNPKARELARRLIMGETITREMASSDETWIAARASAKAFVGIYHAKLLESGVPFDQRRAWLKRQHARCQVFHPGSPPLSKNRPRLMLLRGTSQRDSPAHDPRKLQAAEAQRESASRLEVNIRDRTL